MARLFLVVTKGFSSNYPKAGFAYKTWEPYIYVYISSCIISQKPLERVRNHKTSAVISRIVNPLGKRAQNRKAGPDLGGGGGGMVVVVGDRNRRAEGSKVFLVLFIFSLGLLIKSSKAAWQ